MYVERISTTAGDTGYHQYNIKQVAAATKIPTHISKHHTAHRHSHIAMKPQGTGLVLGAACGIQLTTSRLISYTQ
jgi:hypothetical protein